MPKLLAIATVPDTLRGFILPFAYHFRNQGWQVDAIAQGISNCAQCQHAFDHVWDVEWSRNPLAPQNLINAPKQIHTVLAQQDYDIVHVHTPVAAFVTRYALSQLKHDKPKVIYTAHGFHFHSGGTLLKNAVYLTLEKLAGRWTDYLVVINREDEQAAKRFQIVACDRIRYLPGIGVDLDYYSLNAVSETEVIQLRTELGLAPDTPLFLSVAEFIPRKRHRDILAALARLARAEVHLAFAGEGPLLLAMQRLAVELDIQNQVHFLGFRQDIPTLMRASVATILASQQEGLPRSVMESLSLEIPVIGTEIRGIRDLLATACGLLFSVGDVEGLAQAMTWILDHPEDAKNMGIRGRKHMTNYSLKQIVALHEALYAEAINTLVV